MINVLIYIALMGFISVLYVIVVLYIDAEKLDESFWQQSNKPAVTVSFRILFGILKYQPHFCRLDGAGTVWKSWMQMKQSITYCLKET